MELPQSFGHLVERICLERHGTVSEMNRYCGVGHTTLLRWMRNEPGFHKPHTIDTFCRKYGLNVHDVWVVIQQDELRQRTGEKVPTPTLGWVKVGPPFKAPKRRGALVGLTLLALTAGGVPPVSGTMSDAQILDNTAPYRKRNRRYSSVPAWGRLPIAVAA